MTRPVSLLEIPLEVFTVLTDYDPRIVSVDVGAGVGGVDLYYLKLTIDVGGWSWSNKIQTDDYIKVGACANYVSPAPVLRSILITLRSNEWIVSRAIERVAELTQDSYCTTNPQALILLDYNTPEWTDLPQGFTRREGFISPASIANVNGNYTQSKGLASTEESNRVRFDFCEFKTRFN